MRAGIAYDAGVSRHAILVVVRAGAATHAVGDIAELVVPRFAFAIALAAAGA